jgi:hypothetical protein
VSEGRPRTSEHPASTGSHIRSNSTRGSQAISRGNGIRVVLQFGVCVRAQYRRCIAQSGAASASSPIARRMSVERQTHVLAATEGVRAATTDRKRSYSARGVSGHARERAARQPRAWSGRRDLSSRPPDPQTDGCAAKSLNHKWILRGDARRTPRGPGCEAYYRGLTPCCDDPPAPGIIATSPPRSISRKFAS